ncbi:DMT family transporter [Gallibacterium anatis]|nr:DMT family transporter [Gallibacterium anatis]MDK9560428.1 DMT family transporter [Gallibacterium anatis]
MFSKVLLANGLNAESIAFIKTLIAFLLVSLILFRHPLKTQLNAIQANFSSSATLLAKIAFCAFLGIFVMFIFETSAYQYGQAANVIVVLMAASAVFSLVGGWLLLSERIHFFAIIGTFSAILGIFIISWSGMEQWKAIVLALIAGAGYGFFSVFMQKFHLQGGLAFTQFLMLFGSLYLFIPFIRNLPDIHWSFPVTMNLLALAILPTLLGFFCTTKALSYLSAVKVQVTELSEPLFAMLLAWLFWGEFPSYAFYVGAFFIIVGIVLINQMIFKPKTAKQSSSE